MLVLMCEYSFSLFSRVFGYTDGMLKFVYDPVQDHSVIIIILSVKRNFSRISLSLGTLRQGMRGKLFFWRKEYIVNEFGRGEMRNGMKDQRAFYGN